jgi:hypothetical protein
MNDGEASVAATPIDQELAQMSKELDNQPVKQTLVKKNENEEKISDSPNIDVKRYVELEPNEELALVQYNVPAQIISTKPGDKVAIVPVGGKSTTPFPTTTSKSPHPHMFCNSCGKMNPKERGLITSYIDVSSSRECASLCARYLTKGKRCDVWEYHGEWRNKQCFLLCIPDFTKCKGDIGLVGEMSFESGTCDRHIEFDDVGDSGVDDMGDLSSLDTMGDSELPSWFPRAETSVGAALGSHSTAFTVGFGALFLVLVGAAFMCRSKRSEGYTELLDNRDEV